MENEKILVNVSFKGITIEISPTKKYLGLKSDGKLICSLGWIEGQFVVSIHHRNKVGRVDIQKVKIRNDQE